LCAEHLFKVTHQPAQHTGADGDNAGAGLGDPGGLDANLSRMADDVLEAALQGHQSPPTAPKPRSNELMAKAEVTRAAADLRYSEVASDSHFSLIVENVYCIALF
jgi:hypothetical protein